MNLQRSTNYDLNFLQHIQEVSGFVAILGVETKEIYLPKLQIIHGWTLSEFYHTPHNDENTKLYGLVVVLSDNQTLKLPALREISYGSVKIMKSDCYVHSIDWSEIISQDFEDHIKISILKDRCPECHPSCEKGCWGEGPENCQKFNKINCSIECFRSRCFGSESNECCHEFCAGGCTGPSKKDCFACKNFNDDGECKQECLEKVTYEYDEYGVLEKKFAYGSYCVKKCFLPIRDQGGFVNGPCLKFCKWNGAVNEHNIRNFADCTIIDGNLIINDETLTSVRKTIRDYDDHLMYWSDESFNSVTEITGYLKIQVSNEDIESLSLFHKLEKIGGLQLVEGSNASLHIENVSCSKVKLKCVSKILYFDRLP